MLRKVFITFGLLVIGFAMISCGLLGGTPLNITMNDRLDLFKTDLNSSDRSTIFENFDPSISDYEAIKGVSYWDEADTGSSLFLLSNQPYAFVIDTAAVVGSNVLRVEMSDGTGLPQYLDFYFSDVGSGLDVDYRILKIVSYDSNYTDPGEIIID